MIFYILIVFTGFACAIVGFFTGRGYEHRIYGHYEKKCADYKHELFIKRFEIIQQRLEILGLKKKLNEAAK